MKRSEETTTLYLLDGYSIIYRSYFAFMGRHLSAPDGTNVSALFGFFRTLFSILDEYRPGALAVVLDSRVPTFRHEMYPEYKANREKAPEELHAQVPMIEEILGAMGMTVLRKDGVEADDIIATMAERCRKKDCPCVIVTGDKDLLQLLGGEIRMLRPEKGGYQLIGRDDVFDQWGVEADQIVDYLSLTGDQADNVPGVKGIGPKTASKLLTKFGDLDGVYENLNACSTGERTKLEASREDAFLSRSLIILKKDVSLPPEAPTPVGELNREAAVPLLLRYGAKSLAEQAKGAKISEKQLSRQREKRAEASAVSDELLGEGRYEQIDDLEGLDRWIEKALTAGACALDIETDSLDAMLANPVGFSLAVSPKQAAYLPLIAEGQRKFDDDAVRERLVRLTSSPSVRIIGHNFKYDYKVLRRWGVVTKNLAFDTMVAAWLLDTTANSYGMDPLAASLLGYKTISFKDVVPKDGLFQDISAETATRYAAEDADITFRFYELFRRQLKERGLEKLFFELEMPLVPILAEMECAGITLLSDRLEAYGRELEKDLGTIEDDIWQACGHSFNINSTKQLQQVLFEERKLTPIKKTKTGYSTDISVLEELAREDVVPLLVLRHRSLAKLKSTYVDALPKLVNPETGRIHTQLIQTGTATGRLSSKDPNLQNIPIRDEEGRRIRSAFVPAEGHLFISADYSQIELVVLAHLSEDPELSQAFRSGGDVHRRTASLIFDVSEADVSSEQRRIAKTINFGVMYGMSAFRLSRELGISRSRADSFISAYFRRYFRIQSFMRKVVQETEQSGVSKTLLGRERSIPAINSRNKTEKAGAERIAVNTPIQGTAADIVKLAMLAVSKRMASEGLKSKMVLQIHDELLFEVPFDEADRMERLLKEEMESAVKLSVPLTVSIERGGSWGDLH
ncbi:DNA polymerase I [Sediminispirochaeta bajacaliforniensis]|uniref:DNA polymerase I n=1 Tax=Sediminispirochaeta bajacaliforniensis TaxID=148 RepID=UPI00035C7865|nr:DNA polymerase I [Sediminispirochaeta bajacaliforniensis]